MHHLIAIDVSFHSYQCIQLGTNSPETLKSGRNWHFLSPMTTKLDWWHWKTIGHLSYASSSFMHHFIVISEFKFELQFRNAQIGSNLTIFCPRDIKISIMTLKNNRAPFLYPFKLYASSHSHWCIEIWVTFRKLSNWVKIDDFLPPVTLKFDRWPWKTIGHLFYAHSSFIHHFIVISEFQFELESGNGRIGFRPLWPWPLTSDLALLYGRHFCFCKSLLKISSWHDDRNIVKKVWWTDGRTEPFKELLGRS